MRKIILSVTAVVLIGAGISIGSMIQAASRPVSLSAAGTLSPHDLMLKLARDLPVENWEHF